MTTTLKKLLSVLMAVAIFAGGIFVSFNIAAENDAYDAVYDYVANSLKSQSVSANKDALGIYAMSGTEAATLYINENSTASGIRPTFSSLKAKPWGELEKPYVVYEVEPGSKFEASLQLNTGADGNWNGWTKQTIAHLTGEPFEFVIEASADGVTWKAAWDTSAETAKDITKVYDVPADCSYVRIVFPQKGNVNAQCSTCNAWHLRDAAGFATYGLPVNDFAHLVGVKFTKPVAQVATYDTTYDYTDTTKFDKAAVNAKPEDYGMYSAGPDLYVYEAKGTTNKYLGINPTWSTLNSKAWGTFETYVIYEVEPGTYFEASLYLASNSGNAWCKQNIAAATGEPFEFVIESSSSADGGWGNKKDTSTYSEKDITMTYKVPADCSFVKITFPQKGYASNVSGQAKIQANDLGRLLGVRYTKAVPKEYNTTYDYTTLSSMGTAEALGMHSIVQAGAASLTVEGAGKGINPNWNSLNGNAWGTLNNAYVIYEVKPDTWFEATLFLASNTGNVYCREKISEATDEPFEFVIEASDSATGGWKNAKDTSNFVGDGTGKDNCTVEYKVPADCSYVRITFPQKGKVTIGTAVIAGNDRAKLMGVRYTKAVPKTYTTEYDYTTYAAANNLAGADYGIYNYSTSGAAGLLVEGTGKGINPNYGTLNSNAWGTLSNPYVIYEVTPGTWFEADLFLYSKTATDKESYIYCKEKISETTGEPFEFVFEATADPSTGWKNAKDTSAIKGNGNNTFKFEYLVPDDCNFVKITFPQKGKVTIGTADIAGNDRAKLMGVRFTAPVPEFNTEYDYTKDLVADETTLSGANMSAIGVAGLSNSNLVYDEKKVNGGINAGRSPIMSSPWGTTEFYLIYEVVPGTKFEADFMLKTNPAGIGVWNTWTKETFAHLAGEPWEFKIEASASDTSGWKNAVTTANQTSELCTIEYEVPDDCKYVKVTFPQKGRVEPFCEACGEYHLRDASTVHYGLQGDDLARLRAVRFTAPENRFDGCDTVIDYKANGPVNFFYDNDAYLIYLYQTNGIAIQPFTSGVTYVAPDADYVKGTGFSKPFVTFAVEPASKFVASINVDRDAAAAIGADFKVKVYESADGATWTENTTAPVAELATDYYSFDTAATTKFVKIEFPHTDAVKDVDKVNEIFGLIKVGLNPNEAAYVIENPFGNYTFGETHKFYGDPRPASFDTDALNIYEIIGAGKLGFEGDPTKPGYYLAHTYGNLAGKESVDKAAFVYSVKPGTAFQVIALVSRDDGFIQMIERKLGTNWDIMLEVSSDGKTWSSYNPSRILTEEHLLDSTPVRYVTEVITIPSVPADVKFIKVIYPQTGDMNKVTEDAFPYCGNDLIGVAQISLTNGGAVPASKFKPDKSLYDTVIDATEGVAPDETGVYVTGLQYAQGMSVLAPSWTYLNGTGGAVMANTSIISAVKEGSAFFGEAAFRSSLHLGEFDENGELKKNADGNVIIAKTVDPFTYIEGYGARLYFSSDRVTWTEVTNQYREVIAGSGALPVLHRFNIAKLPAGVKYVKLELPINRNMIGCPVGNEGLGTAYTGNDFCGIRYFYCNIDEHVEYKSEINYGNYFDTEKYGSTFPTNITAENDKVLGLYSYTPGAFEIKDFTSSDTPDGRIMIKESYLFNKKEVDAPYLVYNVEANAPFYMGVNVSGVGRLSAMPAGRLRLYISETGKDGSWTEFTNYTYVENQAHTFARYYADNLGAKTNYLMIVFPITGDLTLDETINAKGASGAGFFAIRDIYTNVVDFDPNWDNKNDYVFIHPNNEQQVIIPGAVTVVPFNWLYVIIPAAAVLLLAAAAVVIILIIKKKKKNTEPQA